MKEPLLGGNEVWKKQSATHLILPAWRLEFHRWHINRNIQVYFYYLALLTKGTGGESTKPRQIKLVKVQNTKNWVAEVEKLQPRTLVFGGFKKDRDGICWQKISCPPYQSTLILAKLQKKHFLKIMELNLRLFRTINFQFNLIQFIYIVQINSKSHCRAL